MSGVDCAVVLLNMGGPNNLFEVELFLKNMFADPLILSVKSPFMRKIIANMIINSHLEKAKQSYRAIGDKSPLTEITFALTQKLQSLDATRLYTYAMRYVPPFSDLVVRDLAAQKIRHIILFSMYPQYSKTTTLSSVRDFMRALNAAKAEFEGFDPKIEIVENYPEDAGFIESCVEKITAQLSSHNAAPSDFALLLSAHSIPQKNIDEGDIYESEVKKTAHALESALKARQIHFKHIATCYQSKLGPTKWLSPSTIDTIKKHKNSGILISPIAFSIDNSETRYELSIQNKKIAENLGVKNYLVCECLNDSETFARAILNLIKTNKKDINEANL